MKKIYTLTVMMLLCFTRLMAQSAEDIQFVYLDENGEETGVVADGAVITVTTVHGDPTDEFDEPYISSGIGVKNVCANGRRVQLAYDIKALPSGQHSICFFGSCLMDSKTGATTYPRLSSKGSIINVNALKAGSVTSLKAEWFFLEQGTATVTYTANICTATGQQEDMNPTYKVAVTGPTVTVNYVYDPSGIEGISAEDASSVSYYTLAGTRTESPVGGIFLKRVVLRDGRVLTTKVIK